MTEYSSLYLAYVSAIMLGLLHGSDPGHGWPLSALYSVDKDKSYRRAVATTSILAVGHFISTLFVVSLVWMLGSIAEAYLEYIQLGAGMLLLSTGLIGLYRGISKSNHDHNHHDPAVNNRDTWSLFKYSLLLGFVHEEEIALAAIILLGAHPLLLALGYSLAVYASMLFWTITSVYMLTLKEGLAKAIHTRLHILSPLALTLIGIYILITLI
ncbi:MAG: hypothetical protein GSR85_07880 [Desulfurococcales archaeon]|nr:hypothetical protein [Desulfurococcales archaeon]